MDALESSAQTVSVPPTNSAPPSSTIDATTFRNIAKSMAPAVVNIQTLAHARGRELTEYFGGQGGDDLYPNRTIHRGPTNYFGAPIVRQYSSMMVETPVYLRALLRDFYNAGGRIVVKEFRNREEVM